MKFLHAADLHLGYYQYNNQARFNDFGAAFHKIVDCAIQEQVQVCLLAGDLFHKSSINPATLIQAEDGLQKLRENGIRTLAISGNHDRPRYGQAKTWLDYLDARGLIKLLESFTDERYVVEDESYVDIDGVRFIGMPWYGASTRNVLEAIASELPILAWDGVRYSVLMAHTGIEGQMLDVPDMLRFDDVAPLQKYVDYLALGHLHKPYEAPPDAPWIFNPGAIENNTFDEAFFSGEKGVFVVTIKDDDTAHVSKHEIKGRPFRKIEFSVTRSYDFMTLVDQLTDKLQAEQSTWRDSIKPVVTLIFNGTLRFDRAQFNVESLRELAQNTLDCLLVRINTRLDNLAIIGDYDDELTAEQLEREVFTEIAREKGYGEYAKQWAIFLRGTKRKALSGDTPEDIHTSLRNHLGEVADDEELD